jgi:predicted GH43/DUF377 family glycosyl hydrolase
MAVKNLDYQCYKNSVEIHKNYQEDWLKNGYAPRGFYLKDFCLISVPSKVETGSPLEWHLFHIAGTPDVSCCLPGNEIWFGHASTYDFITWKTHLPCFYIDPAGWDHGHVFAPYVIKRAEKYWMFYTGTSFDNTQRIGAAVSDDLFNWIRQSSEPIINPDRYGWAFCPREKGAACRDPHVMEIDGKYVMYYTAVTKEGRACVAGAVSTDLLTWEDIGPVYTAPGTAHCESSNVQKRGDRYYLFFGGHYKYWSYVVSDSPYHFPAQDPIPLKEGITAMEVIHRKDHRWLTAYFKSDCYRMFLGILDWNKPSPEIVQAAHDEQLRGFLS